MARQLLGKWTSMVSRVQVYELPDSLEVESNEQFEVTRRRVFLDDVRLVTYHRRRGVAYLVVMGTLATFANFFVLVGIFIGGEAQVPLAILFGLAAVPSTIAFLVRLLFGLDIITVYGRRSKLALRFRVRKERAREVYTHILEIVRNAQRQRAAEYAERAAEIAAVAETVVAEQPPPPPIE